jgi:hypothetical protein
VATEVRAAFWAGAKAAAPAMREAMITDFMVISLDLVNYEAAVVDGKQKLVRNLALMPRLRTAGR